MGSKPVLIADCVRDAKLPPPTKRRSSPTNAQKLFKV
jgi:hypothetical protein